MNSEGTKQFKICKGKIVITNNDIPVFKRNIRTKMDHQLLSAEIIRILRGTKSQEWLARRMGVSKTQIHRWETSKNNIRWDKFVLICNFAHRKIDEVFANVFNSNSGYSNAGLCLQPIISLKSLSAVEQQTGYSKQSLKKWLNGDSLPTLSQMLAIWHQFSTHTLYLFLDELVGLKKISSFDQISKKWDVEKLISTKYPYIAGLLKLAARGFTEDELKKRAISSFEVTPQEYEDLIAKLIEIGILKKEANTINLIGNHIFDSSQNYELLCYLNSYWCKHIAKKISQSESNDELTAFSYLVMNLSQDELSELKNDLYALNLKARQMSKNDAKESTDTFAFTIQLTAI